LRKLSNGVDLPNDCEHRRWAQVILALLGDPILVDAEVQKTP
jgi:hypothetical protein